MLSGTGKRATGGKKNAANWEGMVSKGTGQRARNTRGERPQNNVGMKANGLELGMGKRKDGEAKGVLKALILFLGRKWHNPVCRKEIQRSEQEQCLLETRLGAIKTLHGGD